MKKIYSKNNETLLHIVNRLSDIKGREDVIPEENFLQLATLKMPLGKTFRAHKHFKIGKNAWVQDYSLIDEIKTYIDSEATEGKLFLFCAGPFGNILTHQLYEHNKNNTYIDIGSTLNVYPWGS